MYLSSDSTRYCGLPQLIITTMYSGRPTLSTLFVGMSKHVFPFVLAISYFASE